MKIKQKYNAETSAHPAVKADDTDKTKACKNLRPTPNPNRARKICFAPFNYARQIFAKICLFSIEYL